MCAVEQLHSGPALSCIILHITSLKRNEMLRPTHFSIFGLIDPPVTRASPPSIAKLVHPDIEPLRPDRRQVLQGRICTPLHAEGDALIQFRWKIAIIAQFPGTLALF
jgi:hypothetical protein